MAIFIKQLESLKRWRGCVQLQETCLTQQGKVTRVLLCLLMHWELCIYGNMMQGIAWKRDCHEILKKAQVEISFGSTGIHGD